MAIALQNQEIAKSLYLLCVRCKNVGRFVCERCSDRYCTKMCQVLDWPYHRKICFPMPSLLEIPSENHMISMCHQRGGDSLALAYLANSQNRYRTESRIDNNFLPRACCGHPSTRPVRQELYESRYLESRDYGRAQMENKDSVPTAQPIAIREEAAASNDTDEIVNLVTGKKFNCDDSLIKRDKQMPQKPPNWDEDNTDHIHDLERLMTIDCRNWQKPTRIETISIPAGVPVELFCLDASTVEEGYISVCIYDAEKIESINQLSGKIKDYLKPFGIAGNNYSPKVDEYCFVYHSSDSQWYRAECVSVISGDKFQVILIDYGIMSVVTSACLRKFAPEFSQPSLSHFCYIKGLPSRPPKELVRKITKFFDENSIFPVESANYNDGILSIVCPKLWRTIA